MIEILGLDIETYSAASIRDGVDAYASHPSTGVHCAVLVLSRGREHKRRCNWVPGMTVPAWAVQHIKGGGLVLAHNAAFEQSIIRHVLHPQHNWPTVPLNKWLDTAAEAALRALPTSLAGFGAALGAKVQKDDEGKQLMLLLATVKDGVRPESTPEQLERLIDYCGTDVDSMLECWSRRPLPAIISSRHNEQLVDRRINTRGVYLDRKFAAALREMADRRLRQLDEQTFAASGDMLSAAAAPLKRYLEDGLVQLPAGKKKGTTTLDRQALAKMLDQDEGLLDDERALLEIRQESGRATSLAKLARLNDMVGADGRLRHALRYCGAHTGRWTSSGLQIHNLPRSKDKSSTEQLRAAVLAKDMPAALVVAPDLLKGLSWLLRSVIAAPPGKDLIGGDYSAIEARVIAWLAGQDDTLRAFAESRDVYTEEAKAVGSDDRQMGKVQVLGLGFGMGPVKFAATAANYGLTLSLKEAARVQRLWRSRHRAIVDFWYGLEHACMEALYLPKTKLQVGKLIVQYDGQGECLRIFLPSGRPLHYWRPKVQQSVRKVQTVNDAGELVEKELELSELRYYRESDSRGGMALDYAYGGKLAENVTQAVARDLLMEALVRFDVTCYDVVMHVHDSIVAEVPERTGRVEEFSSIMAAVPAWATGLPIAVDVYRSKHFRG